MENIKVMCIGDFEESFEKKKIYSGFKSEVFGEGAYIIMDTNHHNRGLIFFLKEPHIYKSTVKPWNRIGHIGSSSRYFEDHFEILEEWRNFRIETILS